MKYQLAVINKFHEISQPPRIEQNLSSPRAKRGGPKGLALRALGLLLADGTPTVGGGKTF